MTADIRDGVEWQPWFVRYAEFEGRTLRLADTVIRQRHMPNNRHLPLGRYDVGIGPIVCSDSSHCAYGDEPHCVNLFATDVLDEALAAFHEAEEKLLAGEL